MEPIILIRHGQSRHHVEGLTGGWTDTDLTDLGRQQAASLARRLAGELEGVSCHLLCSDLLRASQTAEIVGESLGVDPVRVPELREFNNGIAAGMTLEEAAPHQVDRAGYPLDWQPYPEAETWRSFYLRIEDCMQTLTAEHDGLGIIVTHGGSLVNAVVWWLGLGLGAWEGTLMAFGVDPTSITVLRTNHFDERMVERLNDTAHLYADGLSEGMSLQPRGNTSTEYTNTSGTE